MSAAVQRETIRGIVAELAPRQVDVVTDDLRLVDDLEYTSLAVTELAFTLEDEFDLQPIDEAAARAIVTVGDICAHVEGERNGQGSASGDGGADPDSQTTMAAG